MTKAFGDRLVAAVKYKKSVAVIGIDPRIKQFPPTLRKLAESGPEGQSQALSLFGLGIIEAVHDIVPAVKPNIAFYESFGINGIIAYNAICAYAHSKGLLVVGDVKRGDIGSTAAAYATGLLQPDPHPDPANPDKPSMLRFGPHDAITLNPYLGTDSVTPFLETGLPNHQGFFLLVKTSNPSSADLQDLELKTGGTVAEAAARLVDTWGKNSIGESGLSDVGAVVGATHPDELQRYRELMPNAPFLIPGYGAQGGTAEGIIGAFREDGSGAIVNASRSVIFAWEKEESPDDWQGATRRAAMQMNGDLLSALKVAGKWNE